MQVGVAAHSKCYQALKFNILTDEICQQRIQVVVYKCIDVCAVTKYLLGSVHLKSVGGLEIGGGPCKFRIGFGEGGAK